MRNENLAECTANRITEYILQNGLKPGDKIPTEMRLAEMFLVSRTTIREAEKLLRSRNVLEIRQGAGTFVSGKMGVPTDPLGFSMVSDQFQLAKDLMALRIQLEPFDAELASIHATREEIRRLWELQTRLEQENELREFEKIDLKFHITVAQASHNIVMQRVIPIIEEAFGTLSKTRKHQPSFAETRKTHRNVIEAIERKDAVGARNNMIVHLMLAEMVAEEGFEAIFGR